MRRLLAREDRVEATETLTLAFDEDPMFRFLMPDDDERRDWLRLIMAGMVGIGACDSVFTTEGVRGVIGVVPPGRKPLPSLGVLGFLFRSSGRPKLRWPNSHLRSRFLSLIALMHRLHIREAHYYVQVLGVHPDHQGKGLARALLEPMTLMADQERVSAYLETAKEQNLGLYRHFGFEVMEEVSLQGRGATLPPLWAMKRPAT